MFSKRTLYITLFTLLGYLLQQIIHGVIEIGYTNLLLRDFSYWGFGFSWNVWIYIHHAMTLFLLVFGLWFGFTQGMRWWKFLYLENGELRPEFGRKWRI